MIECESRIHRVIVYARGAVVARRVSLPADLPAETVEITVRGVTPFTDPASIRALADGEREVVGLRSRLVMPAVPAPAGSLLESVRELRFERARLRSEHEHRKARRELLALIVLDPGMARAYRRVDPSARIGDALALSGLVERETEATDQRLAQLDAALQKNARALQAAELAAAQVRTADLGGEGRASLDVILELGPGGGALRSLEIEYVVGAARWFPAYTARVAAGATRVEWAIEAFVAQASAEDWVHVELALSTADLAHDARLPELASLRLGRAQPPARKGYRAPPEGLDAMFEGFDTFTAALPATRPSRRGVMESLAAVVTSDTAVSPVMQEAPALERGEAFGDALYEPLGEVVAGGGGGRAEGSFAERETLPSADAEMRVPVMRSAPLAGPLGAALSPSPQSARVSFGASKTLAPPTQGPLRLPSAAPVPAFAAEDVAAFATEQRKSKRSFLSRSGPATTGAPSSSIGVGSGFSEEGAQTILELAVDAFEPADAWLDFDAARLGEPTDRAHRGRLVLDREGALAAEAKRAYAAIERVLPPPHTCDPRESRGLFDHRYDAEGLAEVPSNARPHRVPVAVARAPSTPRFITVPRESAEVYREVEIKNPFDAPLLSGPVEVFVDGALMTQSSIGYVDRGGFVLLGLGVEERIRVARNARVEEGSAGLLGGSTVVEHTVGIDIASSLGHDLEVAVIDRIPVSDDKDVEIKQLFARPPAEPYTQVERGHPVRKGLRWQVPVPAGGKARVEFGYRVTLPAKSEIVGGNRRE